jgi:hypothetical protein
MFKHKTVVITYIFLGLLTALLLFAVYQKNKVQTQTASVCVDISVGETGYYGLVSNVELQYYKNELTNIKLYNPTLLSFKASERWNGGYYVYSFDDVQQIIKALRESDSPDVESIIDALQSGLLITQAST